MTFLCQTRFRDITLKIFRGISKKVIPNKWNTINTYCLKNVSKN